MEEHLKKIVIIYAAITSVVLTGCPMDPLRTDLLLRNESQFFVKALINVNYPDSSLSRAIIDRTIEPGRDNYVGSAYNLHRKQGVTLFLFEEGYFDRRRESGGGTPDKYLEADSTLTRFYLSTQELDSLGWRLTFP
jgi:hypothetical protein